MNTTLAAPKDRPNHPPEPSNNAQSRPTSAHRVGLIDRIALHLGVALITWSRRPHRARLIATAEFRAEHQLRRERLALARTRAEQNYPRFIIR
ncbi:hypothetical protein [Rhodoglobus sp.]